MRLVRLVVSLFVACVLAAHAGTRCLAQTLPTRAPLTWNAPVQDKNFYLLSLIARDAQVRKVVQEAAPLKALLTVKAVTLATLFEKTKSGDTAVLSDLMFTEDEIVGGEKALASLYATDSRMKRFADGPLRLSGMYQKYQSEPGGLLLAKAWRDCALGINNIINVYGLGNNGRSPQIDGISYDPKSFLYKALLHNALGMVREDEAAWDLFFQPGLTFALALLDLNRRDEAGRFEPLEGGENRAAYRRAASLDWRKYPYTVIVVPGYGPEEAGVRLSPAGKLALTLAVRRFKQGMAPFILVSGGYVHPKQTPYCEAYEMKQSLLKDFGIPENAILIEPHARHTTTNLRNAARLMYRYGFPFDRPGLITTNTYQSADIESLAFRNRCQNVFGYQPHEVVKRLSPFDLVFLPRIDSLYADPQDPLDP